MPISACFSLALRALRRNRLRSSLTLLGVTIGVAVVITMVALGTGARMSIEQHVKAAGTNQITVVAGNYLRITDDYGSDVIESGGGGEAGDDGLGGLAGGSGVSGAPKVGHASEEWWPGRGISPRLPGKGAALTLTVADAEAIAGDVKGVSYRAPGVTETAVVRAPGATLFARLQGTDADITSIRVLRPITGQIFHAEAR